MSMTVTLKSDLQTEVESALQRFDLEPGSQVRVEVTESSIILTPVQKIRPGAELDEIMAELDRDFGNTFRALAK